MHIVSRSAWLGFLVCSTGYTKNLAMWDCNSVEPWQVFGYPHPPNLPIFRFMSFNIPRYCEVFVSRKSIWRHICLNGQ
ncbi:hypothetical protein B0H13DRAFT_2033377 [Mycena leptocephala]|nr:hypothetical protein B0H13DRAFT_2033377 [Mycena leptocephala]